MKTYKKTEKTENKETVADKITANIIAELEKGNLAWSRNWTGTAPTNAMSKKEYRGINRLNLMLVGMDKGFQSPYWMTYNQAKDLGGNVIAGSKGSQVIYWKVLKYDKIDEETQEVSSKSIPYMRYSTVFNLDQIENIDKTKFETKKTQVNPVEEAEKIIRNYQNGPAIEFGCFNPCYRPATDEVKMPAINAFNSEEGYYSTMFHELGHSTGHATRLNREEVVGVNFFGSHNYATEELVAEFTSAFCCASCGMSNEKVIENQAAYVQNWLKVLKNDRKMVINAAARAEKSYARILGR